MSVEKRMPIIVNMNYKFGSHLPIPYIHVVTALSSFIHLLSSHSIVKAW